MFFSSPPFYHLSLMLSKRYVLLHPSMVNLCSCKHLRNIDDWEDFTAALEPLLDDNARGLFLLVFHLPLPSGHTQRTDFEWSKSASRLVKKHKKYFFSNMLRWAVKNQVNASIVMRLLENTTCGLVIQHYSRLLCYERVYGAEVEHHYHQLQPRYFVNSAVICSWSRGLSLWSIGGRSSTCILLLIAAGKTGQGCSQTGGQESEEQLSKRFARVPWETPRNDHRQWTWSH